MYRKLSIAFLIASLVQAGIIALSEVLGISNLGVRITLGQLFIHVLVGQAGGFLLMVITQGITSIRKMNFIVLGSIYGVIAWIVLVLVNSAQGNMQAPWTKGLATVVVSLLAFVVFGLILAYIIKKFKEQIVRD